MSDEPDPGGIGALVRRHDPDRFLTALFASPARREALFVLYAFNHELARAREAASEPMLALIRLQWWREVVEGARRRHPVAEPLGALLEAGVLDRADLLGVIAAREVEADPAIGTVAAWRDYLLGGAGGLAVAAGRLLGAPEPEALRPFGAAYGAAGVLRSVPALARQGRCLLPADALAAQGLVPEGVISEGVAAGGRQRAAERRIAPRPVQAGMVPGAIPKGGISQGTSNGMAAGDPRLRAVLQALAAEGRSFLDAARAVRVPRQAIAAVLPAVLARRDLARTPFRPPARGVGDRLAVTWAGLRGRI
jgi:phytoene synthase